LERSLRRTSTFQAAKAFDEKTQESKMQELPRLSFFEMPWGSDYSKNVNTTLAAMFQKTFERIALPEDAIRNIDYNKDARTDGFTFKLRNCYYTAQPISTIAGFKLRIDGEAISPDSISLIVRGARIRVPDAPTINEIWWRFGEVLDVHVEKPGGLQQGSHEMSLTIRMRTVFDYGMRLTDIKKPGVEVSTKRSMKVA
jgi:hypothetical protein